MKKNVNIIQIKGARGIIFAIGVVSCLFAGFVIFPGMVAMHLWNYIAGMLVNMPLIGIFQGVLLWGILVASYYTFRKEKHVVCLRAPMGGLSEEELKKVFAEMKKDADKDPILSSMLKAHEMELKIKKLNEDCVTNPKSKDAAVQNEINEKIESK